MIDTEKIKALAEEQLAGSDRFVVDVTCSPRNEIEVVIDSDTSVDLDACVALSRAIEASLDREAEDFELNVCSAGIGQPLRLHRQYLKLVGGSVEVVLKNGTKILATLREAAPEAVTVAYTEMRQKEGRKRKTPVEVVETYNLADIKTVKEYLDFK